MNMSYAISAAILNIYFLPVIAVATDLLDAPGRGYREQRDRLSPRLVPELPPIRFAHPIFIHHFIHSAPSPVRSFTPIPPYYFQFQSPSPTQPIEIHVPVLELGIRLHRFADPVQQYQRTDSK